MLSELASQKLSSRYVCQPSKKPDQLQLQQFKKKMGQVLKPALGEASIPDPRPERSFLYALQKENVLPRLPPWAGRAVVTEHSQGNSCPHPSPTKQQGQEAQLLRL